MEEIPNGFTGFAQRKNAVSSNAQQSYQPNLNYQYSRTNAARDAEEANVFNEKELAEIDERDRRWSWVEINRGAILTQCSSENEAFVGAGHPFDGHCKG